MTQDELKTKIKAWLKANNKDYAWLADKCGVTRNTINNYLARKVIPESKVELFTSILQSDSLQEDDTQTQQITTRRKRRTREQMREDLEKEIQAAQEAGGYVDQEEEDRKVRLMGVEAQLEHLEERKREREAVRNMEGFDMTDPENADCFYEGAVYRIVIPNNVLKVYKEEAKWLNKAQVLPHRKVTVAMLLAKSIMQVADDMCKYEEQEFRETEKAIRLMEEKAKLNRQYNLLKTNQNTEL
jgi:hypothetical protein